MEVNSIEYKRNGAMAKEVAEYDRTIAVLMEETRPGFCVESARQIICAIMDMGYLVHEITVDELCGKDISSLGFMLVIPHAKSVPFVCAEAIDHFWKQGGCILALGGNLFVRLLQKEHNGYKAIPLENDMLDAASSGKMYPIVIEGITPAYKTYQVENISAFLTEKEQPFVRGKIVSQIPESLTCAAARPCGQGYGMEHRNRYIPLIQAMGTGGRAGGRRGAGVHIMLSDVQMKRPGVDCNRLGYVYGTSRGACSVAIGFQRQDIMNLSGMYGVLKELLEILHRRLYLYEAGSDRFVAQKTQTIKLGAKIMNQCPEYRKIHLEFIVHKEDMMVFFKRTECLVNPCNITDVSVPFCVPQYGTYTVETALKFNGAVVDRIQHEMRVPAPCLAELDEFVKVESGQFFLNQKPWYAFGINYWPLYMPGLEREDYWLGWLDKSNYDPFEVELDLELMHQMGINCVFIRLDGGFIARSTDTLQDFMLRCSRYAMKVSLSVCNITSPLFYQHDAFRLFVKEARLYDNPVLFSYDLAWEVGSKFFKNQFMKTWNHEWKEWIEERYGRIANAEMDWGVAVDRTEDGRVSAPPETEFESQGKWRIKICAYRRFIDDYISRKWNDTVTDMRRVDPIHLVTCRMGNINSISAAFTAISKHTDYTSPEAYRVTNNENGRYFAASVLKVFDLTTKGKPVIWAEYGISLTGANWRGDALLWDIENICAFPWMLNDQTQNIKLMNTSLLETNACGSAPWWFPGGIRRVEMSDYGLCNPDGTLRPGAELYVKAGKKLKRRGRLNGLPDRFVEMDPDSHPGGWAHLISGEVQPGDELYPLDGGANRLFEEVRGVARIALRQAEKDGETIGFRTQGTGTNSANAPLLAIGNTPLNGTNPPRFLNAEFNQVEVSVNGGQPQTIGNNMVIEGASVQVRASIGNLQEATWLKPGSDEMRGGVYLSVVGKPTYRVPILKDTEYLQDAQTGWLDLPQETGEYSLQMEAYGCCAFGEKWKIVIKQQGR